MAVETGQNLIQMGLTIIAVILVTLVLVSVIFVGYMYLKELFRGVKKRRYRNGRQ